MSDVSAVIADRMAIEAVLVRYARGVDRIDIPLIKSTFWPDATDEHGTFNGNAVEFADYLNTSLRKFAATTHVLSNVYAEIDGDSARVECYVTATHVLKPEFGGFRWVLGARYIDRFERRENEWRIAKRVLVQEWLDLPPEAGEEMRAQMAKITHHGAPAPDDLWYKTPR